MIIIDMLRENELTLSPKGAAAMGKAIKEIYPALIHFMDEEEVASRIIVMDLPESDCLKILQLTAKYAGLWAFA